MGLELLVRARTVELIAGVYRCGSAAFRSLGKISDIGIGQVPLSGRSGSSAETGLRASVCLKVLGALLVGSDRTGNMGKRKRAIRKGIYPVRAGVVRTILVFMESESCRNLGARPTFSTGC